MIARLFLLETIRPTPDRIKIQCDSCIMIGTLAEFERSLIRERTQAGVAVARRAGRTEGRPPKFTDDDIEAAQGDAGQPRDRRHPNHPHPPSPAGWVPPLPHRARTAVEGAERSEAGEGAQQSSFSSLVAHARCRTDQRCCTPGGRSASLSPRRRGGETVERLKPLLPSQITAPSLRSASRRSDTFRARGGLLPCTHMAAAMPIAWP
jgi:hypothetical protein